MLGQVEVKPGDIIFADETRILVIPAARKELVLAKANEIRAAEDSQRAGDRLRSPCPIGVTNTCGRSNE